MLRFASYGIRRAAVLSANQCRCVSLQSEKPCATLADKILRRGKPSIFYTHPSYVMAREKMLYTIWVDNGIFAVSSVFFIPYFAVAYFFKA